MNYLPTDIIDYISDFSSVLYLVNVNKSYNNIFSEKCRILKQKNLMTKKVLDTFLIEIKKRHFQKSAFKHFDFYLFHHVTNVQEMISLQKWWLKKYPYLNTELFIDNVIRILGNTYKETEKVLTEYIKDFNNKPIICE